LAFAVSAVTLVVMLRKISKQRIVGIAR
jgi:hypothetical protein